MMRTTLQMFAAAIALVASASSIAVAQYVCPPGYAYYGGVCQPVRPSYSNLVSGAVSGEAAGAAQGYSAAGPVGVARTGSPGELVRSPADDEIGVPLTAGLQAQGPRVRNCIPARSGLRQGLQPDDLNARFRRVGHA